MNGRAVLAVLGFLAAALAGPAAAQDRDSGIYFGGSGGVSQYRETCELTTLPCDDEDTAVRGFAGYHFNRYAALEFGVLSLGEAKGGSAAAGTFKRESEGWDVAAVFFIPLSGNFSLLGRLGAYRLKTTLRQQGPFGDLTDSGANSGFVYGAGLSYTLWKIGLRAEWAQYANVGGDTTGKESVNLLSLGALIKF